jgi:DNA-binding protein H-NS
LGLVDFVGPSNAELWVSGIKSLEAKDHLARKETITANIDLSGYNLGQLKTLQHDIEKAIKARRQDEVQKARDRIMAIAKDAGVSVEDLLITASKKAKKANSQNAQPRYQNPDDSSQTWTGRGRQPRWIAEGLSNGKNLNDFRMR